MPRLDKTGPWGAGSRTGWGRGPCCGYGLRRRVWTEKDETNALKEEEKALEEELKDVKERLAEFKD